jgi:hypothetical protein
MANIPHGLGYYSLDAEQAALRLKEDVTTSSYPLHEYFRRQANMCSRLLLTNSLEYVSTIPENMERLQGIYRAERRTQMSFYSGSILALRAVLRSPAALIALRAGWREIEPPAVGEFIERTDEIVARAAVITERARIGLEQTSVISQDLFDWSYDLTGNIESARHLQNGFGYTLHTLGLAAEARVQAETEQLLSLNFVTSGGDTQ